MTAQASIYWRMAMNELQRLAATKGDHQSDAARAYVDRLCDLELERRTGPRHDAAGWHHCSPGFGDGTGASTATTEPLAEAYDRGEIRNSYWHDRARRALAKLPERRLAAAMLYALKSATPSEPALRLSYDQMAASLGHFLQMLDWPPGAQALGWFGNGQAIKRQAWEARAELLLQAKVGVL